MKNTIKLLIALFLFVSLFAGQSTAALAQGTTSVNHGGGTSFGFTSHFSGNATGWVPVSGKWGIFNSMYYRGVSEPGTSASTRHVGYYNNLTYIARMKRTGDCDTCSNRIIIGGTSSVSGWTSLYMFQYTNNGYFSVWKARDGSSTPLKLWTSSPFIFKNDWNKFRVEANGTSFKFYLNGVLLWTGTDSDYAGGQVGLGFYQAVSAEKLDVDWVIVNPTSSSASPAKVAPGVEVFGGDINRAP